MGIVVKQKQKSEKKEYPSVTKSNQMKMRLMEIAEPYFNENPKNNSGQLKFLKNLVVRDLAVSTNVKVCSKRTRMETFMMKNILGNSHSKEVVSVFDQDEDLLVFLNSVYDEFRLFEDQIRIEEEKFFKGESIVPFPSYLLLQKSKEAVIRSMKTYMAAANKREELVSKAAEVQEKEEEVEKEIKKKQDKTEKAYCEFLLGVSWYEILLREFNKNLYREFKMTKLRNDLVGGSLHTIKNYMEREGITVIGEQFPFILKELEKDECWLTEAEIFLMAQKYFDSEKTSFYALLRIVILIESVNINCGEDFWDGGIKECMHGSCLFSFPEKKKNLGKLYRKFNKFYDSYILALYSDEDPYQHSVVEALELVNQYLKISRMITPKQEEFEELLLKKGRKKNCEEKLNILKEELLKLRKELWGVENNLAEPISKAIKHFPKMEE